MESSEGEIALYSYYRSTCSWRIRIILHLKGIKFAYKAVHLVKDGGEQLKEEYTKVNPAQRVPALEIDGHTLTESMAIAEYLEETRPDVPLLPKDALGRAKVRTLCEQINGGTQPIQNLSVLQKLEKDCGGDRAAWAYYWIEKGLTVFEDLLKGTRGKYCVGDEITFADAFLIPQLYNATRYNVDWQANFENISIVAKNLEENEAFKAARPEQQPDFVP